jgi:pimeloyl-ACP methyl ester carboxylesterase
MNLEIITRKPKTGGARPTPLLFVHGAWHGAWCWDEYFLSYFADKGYLARALSLRGHGKSEGRERLRWTSIRGFVADVAQVADDFANPPVIIGHSMGGLVVQKYLEKHDAPAGVLLAPIPPHGYLPGMARAGIRHPLALIKSIVMADPYHLVSTPKLARDALFSADLPAEKVEKYFKGIQQETFLGVFDVTLFYLPRPKRVKTPLLVLGAANDKVFTAREIEGTGRAYHTQAEIFPNMAHDMMLEINWRAVADRIIAWLQERGI